MDTDWLRTDNLDAETLQALRELYQQDLEREALWLDRTAPLWGAENQQDHWALEGLGAHTLSVPSTVFFAGLADGETIEDPGWRKWLAARYPETRVRSCGTRTQVGYEGIVPAAAAGSRRWVKVYASR